MRRRGYTLVEVLTYVICFVVVGALIAAIYRSLLRAERANEATYEVTGMAHTAIQLMRSELEETALATVRTDLTSHSLSFCSPRNQKNELVTSEYATPRWQKSLVYRALDGQLLRWETAPSGVLATREPFVQNLPIELTATQAKVCIRDLTADGFRVQFVGRKNGEGADTLVNINPLFNQDYPQGNTRLLEVEFRVEDKQRQNFYSICWRVSPRY